MPDRYTLDMNAKFLPSPFKVDITSQSVSGTPSYEGKVLSRYEDILDFNSPLYKQFAKYFSSLIPQLGTNQLIAPLAGQGFSQGGSQKIASERAEAFNTKRSETINKGVQEFALGNQNQANGLLSMLLNNQQFQQQLAQQQRQFDASQPDFLDSLLNIGGGILGMGTGNLFSGKSFLGGNTNRASAGI